jgi:hypothetical protein
VLTAIKRHLAGEVPLNVVFFYDMLLVGTLVNIAAGLFALAAVLLELPDWGAVVIFLSPQPYNLMLLVSVWRAANREQSRWGEIARVAAVIWFPAMLII